MSGPRPSESRCFNENSPRPPVPGEERGGYQGRCQSTSSHQPDAPALQPRRPSCDASNDQHQHHRPSNATSCTSASATTTGDSCCGAPHLGYEPETHRVRGRRCCDGGDDDGCCHNGADMEANKRRCDEDGSLACLRWTRSLRALLEDSKGVKLFDSYLHQEGHNNALTFWFACEGLKEESNLDKLSSIYKVLVRKFFQRPKLALLSEELRKEVMRRYREGHADKRMFEQAQQEVERLLEETTYPNFLRSDVYLQYVRECQCAERTKNPLCDQPEDVAATVASGPDNEGPSSPDEPSISCASSLLPTLHEDSEFTSQQQLHTKQQQQELHHQVAGTAGAAPTGDFGKGEMRLTKDMLMATQQFRALDVRPKPEAFAGIYLQTGASPYHASVPPRPRAQYSSYNPVSRQDSELQSLSSDARTESDNLSLTDASLSDNASIARRSSTRKQHTRQYQAMKKSAMMNRDPSVHENIIPRTQRVSHEQTQPMKPEVFARQLIEKLMLLQRDRENEEKLERKLREVDLSTSHGDSLCDSSSLGGVSTQHQQQQQQMPHHHQHHQQQQVSSSCSMGGGGLQSRSLADALREKLQLEEDSDQAILDQHVSRVWSDLTPSRSPKLSSPRPRSPDKCRRQQQQQQQMMATGQMPMHQQSMTMAGAMPRPPVYRSQRKEKDVFSTFSGDSGNVHDFPEASELHASMSSLGSHHLPKSKSVPSDYADSLHKQDLYLQGQDPRYRRLDGARSSATKKSMTELTDSGVSVVSDVPPAESRLRNWLKETDGTAAGCKPDGPGTQTGGSSGGGVGLPISAKPSSNRKKISNAPQQPFVGDPGMPPLPPPHIPDQLEEASRRLECEKYEQNRSRQRYPSSGGGSVIKQHLPDYEPMQPYMQSSQSTLRRGRQDALSEFTTVVFSFCDEKVPYRTKIPGYNVTLRQFKDVLPKKGSYRYFFKTECEDLDMQVIQEEITDDAEVLPLWEGKVMAQVKALE